MARQLPDLRAKSPDYGRCVLAGDFDEHRKSRVPLDQRRDMCIAASGNQIAFPMTRHGLVCDFRGAMGNWHPIDNLTTPQAPDIAVSRLTEHALRPEMLL